ncbi:hypothetical protein KTE52_31060, partial [Burkholderia multivorans]
MATLLECLRSLPGELVMRDLAAVRNEVATVAEHIQRLGRDEDGYQVRTESHNYGRDLPPANRASRSLVKFVFGEEDEHEEALYGTANHRVSEGSRG